MLKNLKLILATSICLGTVIQSGSIVQAGKVSKNFQYFNKDRDDYKEYVMKFLKKRWLKEIKAHPDRIANKEELIKVITSEHNDMKSYSTPSTIRKNKFLEIFDNLNDFDYLTILQEVAAESLKYSQSENEKLKAQLDNLLPGQQAAALDELNEERLAEIAHLEAELRKVTNDEAQKTTEIDALRQQIKEQKVKFQQTQAKEQENYKAKIAHLEAELRQVTNDEAQETTEIDALRQQISSLAAENAEMTRNLQNSQNADSLDAQIENTKRHLLEFIDQIQAIKSQDDVITTKINQLMEQAQVVQTQAYEMASADDIDIPSISKYVQQAIQNPKNSLDQQFLELKQILAHMRREIVNLKIEVNYKKSDLDMRLEGFMFNLQSKRMEFMKEKRRTDAANQLFAAKSKELVKLREGRMNELNFFKRRADDKVRRMIELHNQDLRSIFERPGNLEDAH